MANLITKYWTIIITIISIVAIFVTLQSNVQANENRIEGLEKKLELILTINQTILIRQAEMQKDIEFIKINIQ